MAADFESRGYAIASEFAEFYHASINLDGSLRKTQHGVGGHLGLSASDDS